MKSSVGIIKEIDKLGRICIPKEMRKLFKLFNEIVDGNDEIKSV